MSRYRHAEPGERCAKCNDYAVRVVGTQSLCTDHFDAAVGAIERQLLREGRHPEYDEAGEDEHTSPADRLRSLLLTTEQLAAIPPPEPLIGDLLYLDSLAMLYGLSGVGTSALNDVGVLWV